MARKVVIAAAATASVLLSVAPAAPAYAGDVDIESTTDTLHFARLLPGDRETGRFTIDNDSPEEVVLSLAAEVTGAAENGCLEPEANEGGDATCESSGGELEQWLTIRVTDDSETLWTGRVSELADLVTLPQEIPSGESWDLNISVELPVEAGNEIMGDELWFDLSVTAVAGEDESVTQVLGVEATGADPDTGGGIVAAVPNAVAAGLSSLGLDALAGSPRAQWALTALATGLAALALALRRRRRRPA